jgi:hypothetical protein
MTQRPGRDMLYHGRRAMKMGATTLKQPGDRITTDKRSHAGPRTRSGVITEVFGTAEHEHYLVRWDDGTSSVYYPAHPDEPAAKPASAPAVGVTPLPVPEPVKAPWPSLTAEPGDRLVIHGHHLGEPERDAEILEVRGTGGGAPFLVRWTDTGQRTLVYPGTDASVAHIVTRGGARAVRSAERRGKD